MATILNSAIFNSTILHSSILHKKKLHSFILTQLDDGGYLEFFHLLILPSWIHPFCTKLWLKLFQSDSNSFILTQLDDGNHLEFCNLAFNQFEQKKLHSFILSQLDDGSHLELCHLRFTHFAQNSDSNYFNLTETHSFSLNLMMAAFFNLAILDSTILVFPLILTHTCQEWFPPFAQKKLTHISIPTICTKNFTHSFWLNLMMAAILNSAILHSTILHKKNFTHSFCLNLMMAAILNSAILHSTILHKTLTQSNSIWLKLIHSLSTWWWQPSWTLSSWINPILHKTLTQTNSIWLKLIHSHLTWWWQPSSILPSWIQLFSTKKTSLIYSDSTWWWQPSWILPSLILPSCIQAILHKTLTQTNSIWLKVIHSDSTWWWQPSWILPSCIQPFCTRKTSLIHSVSNWWWQPSWILSSCIQPFCTKLWLKLTQSDSKSFILTQLDDGSHLEFWSCIQPFCTRKTSLIHSVSTWWLQPSWILSSWIQPFCTKLWLKLIQSG